jgi:hypothetical protein
MEAIGDRHHTENLVPTVVIGRGRERFQVEGTLSLLDLLPRILAFLHSIP